MTHYVVVAEDYAAAASSETNAVWITWWIFIVVIIFLPFMCWGTQKVYYVVQAPPQPPDVPRQQSQPTPLTQIREDETLTEMSDGNKSAGFRHSLRI